MAYTDTYRVVTYTAHAEWPDEVTLERVEWCRPTQDPGADPDDVDSCGPDDDGADLVPTGEYLKLKVWRAGLTVSGVYRLTLERLR
jgi:hypothetical protein